MKTEFMNEEFEAQLETEMDFQVSQAEMIEKCVKCTVDLINHVGKMKCININCR